MLVIREPTQPLRRPTNVTLPTALVAEARVLGVNVSRACEAGLAAALRSARAERWRAENQAAMESWNTTLERDGIPLARFRAF